MKSRLAKELPSFRDLILDEKLISPAQMKDVEKLCEESGINFATAFMFKGYCAPQKIAQILKDKFSIYSFSVKKISGLGKLRNLISEEKAKDLQVFPLALIEESGQKVLLLGMTDPLDLPSIRKVEFLTHLKVQPAFLPLDELQDLYIKFFRRGLEIFPVEVTFYGEKASKGRARTIQSSSEAPANPIREKAQLTALIRLLIKNKILSEREIQEEMDQVILESKNNLD